MHISHYGFRLHSPDVQWRRTSRPVLICHLYTLLGEMSFYVFCPNSTWIFWVVVLLLRRGYSLYMLGTSPSSDTCVANIFSVYIPFSEQGLSQSKSLNSDEAQFIKLSCYGFWFWYLVLRILCLNLDLEDFLLYISKGFITLYLGL